MVDNPVTLTNNPHSGIRAADFVGRTTGKLRDYYRIGKVLGTGKFAKWHILSELILRVICIF